MSRYEKHGGHEYGLDVHEFKGMDGRDREGRRLLVGVVEFVKMLVQERSVVQPVGPVRPVVLQESLVNLCGGVNEPRSNRWWYLPDENNWELQEEPQPSVVGDVEIDGGPAAVADVARRHARDQRAEEQRRGAQHDLVQLQFGSQPLGRLAFPVLRPIALTHVIEPLQYITKASIIQS